MTRPPAVDALVRRAQAGDETAFNELYRAHRDAVARLVFRLLGRSNDLDDVVQEIFIHVFRSLPKFRGEARFSTWLYRLAVNVTRMHLRRARSRPRFADVPVPDTAAREQDAPDRTADRHARSAAFQQLLAGLTEKKRTVLVLHDLEGLPAKEIATIVDIPVRTVRTRLFYARKELYAALAADPRLAATVPDLSRPRPQESQDSPTVSRPRGAEHPTPSLFAKGSR